MPARALPNLFALIGGRDTHVAHVPLTRQLQREVGALLAGQRRQLTDLDKVSFESGNEADEDEVLTIDGFELPDHIREAIAHPHARPGLDLGQEDRALIKGFFCGRATSGRHIVDFQVFDRRRLIEARGLTFLHSGGTFRRVGEPGITLDAKLAATYVNRCLYFRSWRTANRVLDLSDYFREATDEDLDEFGSHRHVSCDPELLKENADTVVRKRVALILRSGALDKKPAALKRKAKALGIELAITEKRGRAAVAMPEDKGALKLMLRFLADDVFKGPVTGNRYVSNSKRTLR